MEMIQLSWRSHENNRKQWLHLGLTMDSDMNVRGADDQKRYLKKTDHHSFKNITMPKNVLITNCLYDVFYGTMNENDEPSSPKVV